MAPKGTARSTVNRPASAARPSQPQKGTVTRPSKRSMDDVPPETDSAFNDKENELFSGGKAHTKKTDVTLLSKYGYFKVFEYDNQSPSDKHIVIFFYNKKSKQTYEVRGTIARKYLDLLKNREAIEDFPISDERDTLEIPGDRITFFNQYTLNWDHSSNDVFRQAYATFIPDIDDTLVAYTEQHKTGFKDINLKNWRDVPAGKLKNYAKHRTFRTDGMPSQILLHETAFQSNLKLDNAPYKEEEKYYAIPHFCVNKMDDSGKGNVIQYVDIAERTKHGEHLNDRSVGIEFVNSPIEPYDDDGNKQLNLEKSKTGIYFNTLLPSYPQLFIPLQFLEDDSKAITLTINRSDMINFDTLNQVQLPTSKRNILEEKDGVVTFKYCESGQFEVLRQLLKFMDNESLLRDVVLSDKKHHKSVVVVDDKTYFIFDHGYVLDKTDKKVLHLAIDIREPGIYTHGLIGGHNDGYLQGLYIYLRVIQGLGHQAALQKMIDLLALSKAQPGKKRKPLELDEKVAYSHGKEIEPKSPLKISIKSYVELG